MTGSAYVPAVCRGVQRELSRYLDDDLATTRRLAVERHLGDCPVCTAVAKRLTRTIHACRNERRSHPPAPVLSRAEQRVRSLIAERGRDPRR